MNGVAVRGGSGLPGYVPASGRSHAGTASTMEWAWVQNWSVSSETSSVGFEGSSAAGIRLANEQEVRSALESIERVATHSRTREANWEWIAPETVRAAQRLLTRIYGLVHQYGLTWLSPHVGSDGEGAISFEWWRGAHNLTLYAYADGSSESLLAWGPDTESQMETGQRPSDEQLVGLWGRFLGSDLR